MKIEYVTHASLLLRLPSFSLLTDPFFYFDPLVAQTMCHFPPREISKHHFGNLKYVYSSHIHPDHSHPETLRQLKSQIETVLLPGERLDLEKRYKTLGFKDIIILNNGETLKLEENLEVTSYWDDPIDTVLLIKVDEKSIFHQNDCKLDPKTITKIAYKHSIDYAFMRYTAAQDLYPLLLPKPKGELERLAIERENSFLEYQLKCLEILSPKVVIPYSMTMTYFQPDQIKFNGYYRMTPPEFRNWLMNHYSQIKCWIMQPGDVIDTESDTIKYFRKENLWGSNLSEFLENITNYSQLNKEILPNFDFGEPKACEELFKTCIQKCLSLPSFAQLENKNIIIYVIGNTSKASYIIDFKSKKLFTCNGLEIFQYEYAFLEITMPASILQQFLLKVYDPFSILFSYRVAFKLNVSLNISPKEELEMLVMIIMSIFGSSVPSSQPQKL